MRNTAPDRQRTILVVDDDGDSRDSLATWLERSVGGVRVVGAASGAEGLRALRDGPVDLILADYKMPGQDGIQFLRQARLHRPSTPRILLTSYPDLNVALDALHEAGVHRFLTKPVEPAALQAAVEELLREHRWEA